MAVGPDIVGGAGGTAGGAPSGTGGVPGISKTGGQTGENTDGSAIATDAPSPSIDVSDALAEDGTGAPSPPDAVNDMGLGDVAAPIDAVIACVKSSDCLDGRVCSAGFCLLANDLLVVDNFEDGNFAPNTMGGWVSWTNSNASLVAGEARLVWNGAGMYQSFVESFIPTYCAHDLRPYRKLRFRMRTTAPTAQPVRVFLARTNGTCAVDAIPNLRTISVTTTMQTFDFDIGALDRQRTLFVEIGSPINDAVYFLDDIHLLK